jgi:hypothetical protein
MTTRYNITPVFVDKLSLTYNLPASEQQGFIEVIRDIQNTNGMPLHSLWGNYRGMGYRWNWQLPLPESENRFCLIQAQSIRSFDGFFRVEWNPRRTSRDGNRYVWDQLEILLGDDYQHYTQTATVTRIDIAIDVSPMTPNEIWTSAHRFRTSKLIFGDGGDIRTVNYGSRRGNLMFSIYNRHDEDRGEGTTDPCTTRFEARLFNPCTLPELHSIANPFERLRVYTASRNDPVGVNVHDRFFLDSVRLRGAHAALQSIRHPATKERYRNLLHDHYNFRYWRLASVWTGYTRSLWHIALPFVQETTRVRVRPKQTR